MTNSALTAQSDAEHILHARVENLLPSAPAELLVLGEQPAYRAALEALGYRVTTLSRCQSQDYAQYPTPTREAICQVELPSPKTLDHPFDAALILDFSSDVHPLALFDQLAGLMADDGIVVVLGRQEAGKPARLANWLDYAVAIAGRCGFCPPEPAGEPGGEDFPLVRVFRKGAAPRWRVSHVRPVDFSEIATLFQEVFGHPLSRELWEWKYAAGRGNAVVAKRNGALVSHYGGMYRDVMLCGEPEWVFQICDVMVHPKERGVLTRQGPFLLTAATCAEIYGPLGFGFPNQRAMRVAEKMGLYAEVGQMAEVRWKPASHRFRIRTQVRHMARGNAADCALANQLWAGMAHDLRHGVVGFRDWNYLDHRYFGHPHNHYEVLLVTARLTGKPLGIGVLRRHEASCELLDVIAPLSNLAAVIDQMRRMTARWGLPYLYCWITKNHLPLFLACAGEEEPLDISIPTSCWTADPRADGFKDKWWLMSGDTDFH